MSQSYNTPLNGGFQNKPLSVPMAVMSEPKQQVQCIAQQPASRKNVAMKLYKIRTEIPVIEKKGHHPQGYSYPEGEEVVNIISELMNKYMILPIPSVIDHCFDISDPKDPVDPRAPKKERRFVTRLSYQIEFLDVESGESIIASGLGGSADNQGNEPQKATSVSYKSVLLKAFGVRLCEEANKKPVQRGYSKPYQNPPQKTEISTSAKEALVKAAHEKTKEGKERFLEYWKNLPKENREILKDKLEDFQKSCALADSLIGSHGEIAGGAV